MVLKNIFENQIIIFKKKYAVMNPAYFLKQAAPLQSKVGINGKKIEGISVMHAECKFYRFDKITKYYLHYNYYETLQMIFKSNK